MRRQLPFLIVALVALLMVASATMLYRAKKPRVLTISKNQSASETGATAAVHVRGNANAAVTLEEFGDFECPPCGKLSEPINQLERDYRPRLRVTFRHFPLPLHRHSTEAARAAEAAGLQNRFWEMHDLLYREQQVWMKAADARTLFNAYAGMLGLSIDQFKKDMDSETTKARVSSDKRQGAELGVRNTPTIFLKNHALAPTDLNPSNLRAKVDAAMKELHQ